MDIDLLQQIFIGLQQNNVNLTSLVNAQKHQIAQQLAANQNLQATPAVELQSQNSTMDPLKNSPLLAVMIQTLLTISEVYVVQC